MSAAGIVFLLAGFENSSSTVSFMLYILAINPDVQEKLYQEVIETFESEVSVIADHLLV